MKETSKKIWALAAAFAALLLLCGLGFAQEEDDDSDALSDGDFEINDSGTLQLGKTARLGIEVGTEFVWDIENKSTGLESNVGFEFWLPLAGPVNRGHLQSSYMQPGVRLVVKDMCFQWLTAFFAKGGNYTQDTINNWSNRPLILSYGDITADVVWRHLFFQIAGTTNPMEVDKASLVSIFDDVIDTDDRWYLKKEYALYSKTRYNKLNLPLLGEAIERNWVDPDYEDDISGQMGVGLEFSKVTALFKAASLMNGRDNDNNAWYLGLDASFYPMEEMSINLSGIVGINTEKDTGETPISAGLNFDYKIPLGSSKLVLKPFVGADFYYDTEYDKSQKLEIGAGTYLYFRGDEFLAKHRDVDYDEIIPVGLSLGANVCVSDSDTFANIVLSAFELADRRALVPNLGYFLELEFAGLGSDKIHTAVQAQVEYLIQGRFLPYVNVKYYPGMDANKKYFTDYTFLDAKVGLYWTPVELFSLDAWYKATIKLEDGKNKADDESSKGVVGLACTIRI